MNDDVVVKETADFVNDLHDTIESLRNWKEQEHLGTIRDLKTLLAKFATMGQADARSAEVLLARVRQLSRAALGLESVSV
jgi:hypothetical protein